MHILEKPEDMQNKAIDYLQDKNIVCGFVPTMGALHSGHISLVKKSLEENNITTVSIFVNPSQFGQGEDFEKYPRTIEQDLEQLEKLGVNNVFLPSNEQMYPEGYCTYTQVERMTDRLCGKSRPGHFKGVVTIVNKLFNIVMPDVAYFGQKDYQQLLIIKQMVKDLNLKVKVEMLPIVRENDGLAMSSRNKYLNENRSNATILYESLQQAKEMINNGIYNSEKIIEAMKKIINSVSVSKIDYIAVCNRHNLEYLTKIKPDNSLIALAVYIGETRLIDNILI